MIKRIEYEYTSDDIQLINFSAPLQKTAEISSEMKEAIADIKPDSNKSYILINAMGCSEKWGSNKNGDAFPEKALKEYHKTFEKNAYIYKHHQNKDPQKSQGKVAFSHYNNDMGRVELLLEVDKVKGANLVKRIEDNEKVAFSMGCKIPYDVCSICHNKASKSAEYCDHIKKEKNKVYSDGRKVAMVNLHPNFFDISEVLVPADRTAFMMQKVAEYTAKLSAELGEEWLKENQLKESDIDKRLNITSDTHDIQVLEQTKRNLKVPKDLPGNLPIEWVDDSILKHSAEELLASMAYTQIMPTPKDFQYIILSSIDKTAARFYYQNNSTFEPENTELSDEVLWKPTAKAIEKCAEIVPEYSLTRPYIFARALEKLSAPEAIQAPLMEANAPPTSSPQSITKNPLIPLALLTGLYYSFNKFFKNIGMGLSSPLESEIYKNPILLPILIGGASLGAVKMQDKLNKQYEFNKVAATPNYWLERALITLPGTAIYSGYQETRRQQGEQLNTAQEFVRKNPLLSSLGVFWGSGKLVNMGRNFLNKHAELFISLNPEDFDEIYEKIVN